MSYFDPKIYNYSNLTDADKHIVDAMLMIVCSANDKCCDYRFDLDWQKPTILEKIESEIAIQTIKELVEDLKSDVVDFIVSRIDGYEHDVNSIETTDYFYGFDILSYTVPNE